VSADIRYARNGGVAIAYQIVGDGETDLAYVPDFVSNLVYGWESRHWREFYEQLARSFRLILFDKRGTGLSDHGGQFAALETRMEDLHAVLDTVGSSRTVLLAAHEGCSMAALYAATYPERTRALILFHPFAYRPEGQTEFWRARLAELRERWGTQELGDEMLQDTAPSLYADETEREWFANWLRVGATPAAAYALHRAWIETDLREVLPAVRVPTLIISPFSRDGFVSSDLFDHTSVLRFLETRFAAEVSNLSAWRRATVGDLTSAFNFKAPDHAIPNLPSPASAIQQVLQQCAANLAGQTPYTVPNPQTLPAQETGTTTRPSGAC